MKIIGIVSAKSMECEPNVASDSQKWELTGKYDKRQEIQNFITTGKVTVTAKYYKW